MHEKSQKPFFKKMAKNTRINKKKTGISKTRII